MRFRTALVCMMLAAVFVVGYLERSVLRHAWITRNQPALPAPVAFEEVKKETPVPVVKPATLPPTPSLQEGEAHTDIPTSINLAVPFTPQAPNANWDEFHEEACEEASLLMVHRFYEGDKAGVMDAEVAEHALRKMADFEDALFGFNADTTASQTGAIADQYLGYERVQTQEKPSVDDLKRLLVAGIPIIMPLAGREIGNPYFTSPGPIYHMIVLRGYTADGFITNDPGTRHGEGFVYPFDVIMNALHDWNAEDIKQGAKTVLVVYPNAK